MRVFIPSPPVSTWHLGFFPIRAYAFAIILGIVAAVAITTYRIRRRTIGGTFDNVMDISLWALPFGIIGSRIYHVITTPEPYFGPDGDPMRAFHIWEGGLGIWGAVALGALGVWLGCRHRGIKMAVYLDAVAPALLVAQAIGRLGNWFNQELFGRPTTLPWGLLIDQPFLPIDPLSGMPYPVGTAFHPTFLYEILWNLAMAGLLIWLDRRLRLGHGRVFALYVALYCLGRVWIEMLRIDTAQVFLGLRLNVWTSILVGLGALIAFIYLGRKYPERELDARVNPPLEAPTSEFSPDAAVLT